MTYSFLSRQLQRYLYKSLLPFHYFHIFYFDGNYFWHISKQPNSQFFQPWELKLKDLTTNVLQNVISCRIMSCHSMPCQANMTRCDAGKLKAELRHTNLEGVGS